MEAVNATRFWLQGRKTAGVSVALIVYVIMQAWQSLEVDINIVTAMLGVLGLTIGAKVDRTVEE